ncbi:unnamed protein product [Effrenium voratum]|uniref:Uncharacterized protein n=1 Tax=Effrenium voratum TaxID=2562239 RepID=A0AA36JR92_9DINO|nr:unnamed protein product [Effrenium voratum]
MWPALVGCLARAQWQAVPVQEPPEEILAQRAANTLRASLDDLGARHSLLVSEEDLRQILDDHLEIPREADAGWESPPRRTERGAACSVSGWRRPLCTPPTTELCVERLLPLLLREVHHAMSFVQDQVKVLDAVARVTGTSERLTTPPISGRAFAAVGALESVLNLFLGLFERVDFNPKLGACLVTAMGQKIREALLTALQDHKALSAGLREIRWELAAFGRLAHARYGSQWHSDTALFVARGAGWALYRLARLDEYFATRLYSTESAEGLLQPELTELDTTKPTDWAMELRTALHTGGELWHLDKGLLRFLLANVLRQNERLCDLGAFGGHYAEWLNDTGLVRAWAFDGLEDVEELTEGRVRFARLDQPLHLEGCDVVLCLEVLEHIPREQEATALQNLKTALRALVVSWAPPWQPGPGHVNGRSPQEAWQLIEKATGMMRSPELTELAQAKSTVPWIRESVAIFLRE